MNQSFGDSKDQKPDNNNEHLKLLESNLKEYKSHLDQVQKENSKLKTELQHKDSAILAERNAFQTNTISELQINNQDFDPEKAKKELEFLIASHSLNIKDYKDITIEL